MSWELIGHAWAAALLRGHLASGRVRHAYLLTGSKGVGRGTLANRFAQALLCEAPPAAGDFCGSCRACRLVAAEQHPDLHVLRPEEGGAIKVEDIRHLQGRLALAPYQGNWRLAHIEDFETATDSAQNALLKTLEEPTERVVLVLTAASADAVLPTVASRCEILGLRPIGRAELESALAAGVSESEAHLAASVSNGRPGWALRFLRDPALRQVRLQILDDLQEILRAGRSERFEFARRLADRQAKYPAFERRKAESREILETWLSLLRDGMREAHVAQGALDNPDRREQATTLVRLWGRNRLVGAVQAIERTLFAVERNANAQLAWENLMLDLPGLKAE